MADSTALERIRYAHGMVEDTDTTAEDDRVVVQFCPIDDQDWPCDTEQALSNLEGRLILAEAAASAAAARISELEQAMSDSLAPCTKAREVRDATTCSPTRLDGVCHNHQVIAGLRQHAVDADRFELENRRLRQTLTAAQGIIHEGLHGGRPTDPDHQAACEKPACRRIQAALTAAPPAAPAESYPHLEPIPGKPGGYVRRDYDEARARVEQRAKEPPNNEPT